MLGDLEKQGKISLHPEMDWASSVYWLYSILINDSSKIHRDQLMLKLKENGIESRKFFHPLNILPPYKKQLEEKFPVTEQLSRKGVTIPSFCSIKQEEIEKIAETIRKSVS